MRCTRHSFRISESNFVAILPAPLERMVFFVLEFHQTTNELNYLTLIERALQSFVEEILLGKRQVKAIRQ